jgi:hypothetical protein
MRVRALFTITGVGDDRVYIEDNDGPMSVTNDAEAVVAFVNALHPEKRIVYRDTMGQWDELLHTNGRFDGFAPYKFDN